MIYTLYAPNHIGSEPIQFGSELEDDRFDDVVAVPDGLAKWALILPPLWLAWHRLWGALIIYAAVTLVLLSLLGTGLFAITLFLGGLPGLYLLLEGNNLRRDAMLRDQWQSLGVVEADNESEAIMRFLAGWTEKAPTPQASAAHVQSAQTQSRTARPLASDDRLAFGLFPDGTD